MSLTISVSFVAHQLARASDMEQMKADIQNWANNSNFETKITGSTLSVRAIKTMSQAPSTTTTIFTISGIADNEAGFIDYRIGGNVGNQDRGGGFYQVAYLRSGGTVFFSGGDRYSVVNTTQADMAVLTYGNSGGSIIIQCATTGGFSGTFTGVVDITVTKNTAGLVVT